MKTKPMILGKEVTLRCNGNDCPLQNSKKWLGGKNNELLCLSNTSKDSSKYVMKTNGSSFDLIIKQFSFSDTNCEYTCACGFLQYTDMLKLEEGNVISPPTIYENSHTAENGKLLIAISIQVYPLPTCEITYQEVSSPVNITATDIHGGHNELFKVRLHHIFDTDSVNCIGNLDLTCRIGSHHYILTEEIIDVCKDQHNNKNFLRNNVVIGTSFVSVFIVTLVGIFVCKFVKQSSKTNREDNIKYKTGKYTKEKNELVTKDVPNDKEIDVHINDRGNMLPEVCEFD